MYKALKARAKRSVRVSNAYRWIWNWLVPVVDPLCALKGLSGYLWFFTDWWCYARMPQAEQIRRIDTYPQLHDRTRITTIDAHHFCTTFYNHREKK